MPAAADARARASGSAPVDTVDIAGIAAEMVACGSLEMGADLPDDACRIAELLPADDGSLVAFACQ